VHRPQLLLVLALDNTIVHQGQQARKEELIIRVLAKPSVRELEDRVTDDAGALLPLTRDARDDRVVEVADPATTSPCVVDLGLTDDRGWVVIEANAAWGAGLNGCDPVAAAHCIAVATRTSRGDRVLPADVIGQQSCCHSAARPPGITTDYPERIGT
jgi:hypothetical protein